MTHGASEDGTAAGAVRSSVSDMDLVRRRRSQITAASIRVFIQLGFHKATVRDVAKNAKVSVGLIYQYYGEKEDLLFLALLEIVQAYKSKIPPALEQVETPLERFTAAVQAYCRVHANSSDTTMLAYRETASLTPAHRKIIKQYETETNELIAQCVRDCIAAGVFEDIDVDIYTYHVIMFSHTWALKSWYLRTRMTFDDYLERGLDLLLRSVLTPYGIEQQEKQALRARRKRRSAASGS